MMAKLRRLNTSAPGVLGVFVSMVILRLIIWFGLDYKRAASLRTVRWALKIATDLGEADPMRFAPF